MKQSRISFKFGRSHFQTERQAFCFCPWLRPCRSEISAKFFVVCDSGSSIKSLHLLKGLVSNWWKKDFMLPNWSSPDIPRSLMHSYDFSRSPVISSGTSERTPASKLHGRMELEPSRRFRPRPFLFFVQRLSTIQDLENPPCMDHFWGKPRVFQISVSLLDTRWHFQAIRPRWPHFLQ